MGTKLGKMKCLQVGGGDCCTNSVNELNATECTLKNHSNGEFYYAYFTTKKAHNPPSPVFGTYLY